MLFLCKKVRTKRLSKSTHVKKLKFMHTRRNPTDHNHINLDGMASFIVLLIILLRAHSSLCFTTLSKRWQLRYDNIHHSLCYAATYSTLPTLEPFPTFEVDTNHIAEQYTNHDHNYNHEADSKEFELKQKFVIPTSSHVLSIENKLQDFGFKKHMTHTFTDWYFDLPSPHWCLTPDDAWLSYREYETKEKKIIGKWRLKLRPTNDYSKLATVREELEGDGALHKTLDILSKKTYANTKAIVPKEDLLREWGTNIPSHEKLKDTNLVPFARFETIRSTWISTDTKEYSNLKVDIDGTSFGFMLGEVEMMVTDEYRIKDASQKISTFVNNVLSCTGEEDGSYYKTSKLEMYLRTQSPEHYILLLTSGVI